MPYLYPTWDMIPLVEQISTIYLSKRPPKKQPPKHIHPNEWKSVTARRPKLDSLVSSMHVGQILPATPVAGGTDKWLIDTCRMELHLAPIREECGCWTKDSPKIPWRIPIFALMLLLQQFLLRERFVFCVVITFWLCSDRAVCRNWIPNGCVEPTNGRSNQLLRKELCGIWILYSFRKHCLPVCARFCLERPCFCCS